MQCPWIDPVWGQCRHTSVEGSPVYRYVPFGGGLGCRQRSSLPSGGTQDMPIVVSVLKRDGIASVVVPQAPPPAQFLEGVGSHVMHNSVAASTGAFLRHFLQVGRVTTFPNPICLTMTLVFNSRPPRFQRPPWSCQYAQPQPDPHISWGQVFP